MNMRGVEELGNLIDRTWRRENYAEHKLPQIAAGALQAFPSDTRFFHDVCAWVLADHALPRQVDPDASFGQPPICIYINPAQTFFIQALVWLDSTTAVHQHSFSGAFKVVAGRSLHSVYRFAPEHVVNSRMMFGNLMYQTSEVLDLGDVRLIEEGADFIHAAFHLEHPSVTLVVRTFGDGSRSPQYEYLRPSLAVDPFFKTERLQRNLQVLGALQNVDRTAYLHHLLDQINRSDLYSAFRLVRHLHESAPREDEREAIAQSMVDAHGELGARVVACVEQAARDAFLIKKRAALQTPEHRFFLALLLNVPRRSTILELLEKRFGREPVGLIDEWIDLLCTGEDPALLALDESTVYVLKSMLRGVSFDGLIDSMRDTYDESDVRDQLDDLRALFEMLRTTSYFGPVLRA